MSVEPEDFMCWASNDKDGACQKLMAKSQLAKHVFPGLQDMLPAPDLAHIKSLRPGAHCPKDEKITKYREMGDYIRLHRARLFGCHQWSNKCIKHPGERCQVTFKAPVDVPDFLKPRSISFSSPMCTPWSPHGVQQGEADPNMESFYIYGGMLAASDHDLGFIEEGYNFDFSIFEGVLGPKFKAISIKFGATDIRGGGTVKHIILEFWARWKSGLRVGRPPVKGFGP